MQALGSQLSVGLPCLRSRRQRLHQRMLGAISGGLIGTIVGPINRMSSCVTTVRRPNSAAGHAVISASNEIAISALGLVPTNATAMTASGKAVRCRRHLAKGRRQNRGRGGFQDQFLWCLGIRPSRTSQRFVQRRISSRVGRGTPGRALIGGCC